MSRPKMVTAIKLTGKHGSGRVTYVDVRDSAVVNTHKWYLCKVSVTKVNPRACYYVQATIDGRYVRLHDFIMQLADRLKPGRTHTVDHKDRDTLNNSLSNLSWATKSQQAINREMPLGSTGQRNIHLRNNGKYQVRIRRNKVYNHVGRYSHTLEEAVVARDMWLAIDTLMPSLYRHHVTCRTGPTPAHPPPGKCGTKALKNREIALSEHPVS